LLKLTGKLEANDVRQIVRKIYTFVKNFTFLDTGLFNIKAPLFPAGASPFKPWNL